MTGGNRRGQWKAWLESRAGTKGSGSVKAGGSWNAVPAARHPFAGVVAGIDPSLRGTGLAVLEIRPGFPVRLRHAAVIHNPRELTLPRCLARIFDAVEALLDQNPDISHAALEETIYVQNFRTAHILGAARGAALTALARREVAIQEFAPLRIKQAVCGHGRASKEQVIGMIRNLLSTPERLPSDAADAAATALCLALTQGNVRL